MSDETPTGRAERDTRHHLALSSCGLTKKEMRDVGARNQEHHGDRQLHQPQDVSDLADNRLMQWLHVHSQTSVGVRVTPRQFLHHRAQLLLRNLSARGGRKAANDIDDVRIANGREVTAKRERARNSAIAAQPDIDVGGERRLELGAHDADDGVAAAIEEERSANRIGCRTKQAVPQTVAENRDTARIRLVI